MVKRCESLGSRGFAGGDQVPIRRQFLFVYAVRIDLASGVPLSPPVFLIIT